MKIISMALAILLAGCTAANEEVAVKAKKRHDPLKFRIIQKGQYGLLASQPPGTDADPHPLVAHNRRAYLEIWENHIGPNTPPPEVDFTKETVVFLLNPQESGNGYDIDVKGVNWYEDQLTLVIDAPVTRPATGMETMSYIAPYVVLAVNRPNLSVAQWKRADEAPGQ